MLRPLTLAPRIDPPPARLGGYLWRTGRSTQVLLAFLALVATGTNLLPLELQRRLIDDAVMAGDVAMLWQLAAVYAGAVVLHQAIKLTMKIVQGWLAESAVRRARIRLLDIDRERRAPDETPSGSSVSVLGTELDKLGGFVGAAPSMAVANISMLLGVVGFMTVTKPELAGISIVLLLPNLIVTPLLQRRLNTLIAQQIAAARDFGNAVAEDAGDEVTAPLIAALYDNRIRLHLWKSALKGALGLLNAAAPLAVLVIGGMLVIEGQATAGIVVAFLSGVQRIAGPLRDVITFYREAAQASVRYDLVRRWM